MELSIYNPEIPVQSAAPISVLLDNLAVPSEARIRSICFLGSSLPGIKIRLDGFPSCALAARAACAAVASNETEQELQTGNPTAGQRDSTPSGQAGIILRCLLRTKYNLGRGFQKKTGGP